MSKQITVADLKSYVDELLQTHEPTYLIDIADPFT